MGIVGPCIAVSPSSEPRNHQAGYLWLSPSRFRLCWWVIEVFHLTCATFSLTASAVHTLLVTPSVYENNSLIAIPRDKLILAAWSYLCVGSLHFGAFGADVVRSLRSRQLTFGHDTAVDPENKPTAGWINHRLISSAAQLVAVPVGLWGKYFSINGFFGARGALFAVGFNFRQLIEVILQTYQAHQISQSVPRVSILDCVVLMIIVNGIVTPLVHALLHRRSRIARRTIILGLDVVVDLVISVVVPLAIVVPRLLQFQLSTASYPQELVYDDVWITVAVSEARQVLVTSTLDFISSLFPFVVTLVGLDTIKSLIRRRSSTAQVMDATSTSQLKHPSPHRGLTGVCSIQPQDLDLASSSINASTNQHAITAGPHHPSGKVTDTSQRKPRKAYWLEGVTYLSVAWTLSTVVVHWFYAHNLSPDATSTPSLCALRMNSWMTSHMPCAVARVSCHRLGTTGADGVVRDALAVLDRQALARLVISHCPDLHVPSIITEFSNLRGFMTFNCTLSSWPMASALTTTSTPLVVTTHFIDTNFTMDGFPDGIYHTHLPVNTNLLVYQSNLSKLPETIGEVWGSHKWTSFWIENAPLRKLPASFADLNIVKIALMGTELTSLDDEIFTRQNPTWVRLSRNPLTVLPTSLVGSSVMTTLNRLILQNTSIATLSPSVQAWIASQHPKQGRVPSVVSFYESPVCDDPIYKEVCQPLTASIRDDYRYDIVVPQRPL